jgi:RHS repeat-associated protein
MENSRSNSAISATNQLEQSVFDRGRQYPCFRVCEGRKNILCPFLRNLVKTEDGTPVTVAYDSASRLITSTSGTTVTTYTYDVNGNTTGVNAGGSLSTLTWDKENRLIRNQRTASSLDESYFYNAFNHKTARGKVGIPEDFYIYDGDQYIAYALSGGPIDTSFEIIDGLISSETVADDQRYNYLTDALGSVFGKADLAGNIVSTARYKPFGALLTGNQYNLGWTGNSGSWHTGARYAEQYNWNRHYSTRTKQWISRDILWPQEHAYGYVGGNPAMWTDPEGLWIKEALCVAACVGALGCAGGLLYACKDWNLAYDTYAECAMDFLSSLPAHSLIGCGASLIGCIACIVAYVRPAKEACQKFFDGRCTDAEFKKYGQLFIHQPWSCDGKRKCDEFRRKRKSPEVCAELERRIAHGTSCVSGRLIRMGACYKSDRNPTEHAKQLAQALGTLTNCSMIYAEKGCGR